MSFPRYPTYKDSGVEWLGEVPEHWGVLPIKRDLDFLTSGSRGWAENYADDGELFLRIGNLTRDNIGLDLSDVQRVVVPAGVEGARTKVQEGDLLFSVTAYLGSVAVIPHDFESAYVSQHIALVRLRRSLFSPKWVAYGALSTIGKTWFETQGYGGTKIQLSLDDVKELLMTAPPLSEQSAITEFLDLEIAKIDGLVAEQRRLIELLKEKRQAVISHAVTKGLNPDAPMKPSGNEWLGDVPEHWDVVPLKRLISPGTSISYGIVQPGESLDDGVPFVQTTNMTSGDFTPESLQKTSSEIAGQYPRSTLIGGEVLLGIRASIGAAHVVPHFLRGANLSRGVARIVPCKRVSSSYLVSYFATSAVSRYWQLSKQGSTFNEVSIETVRDLEVTVPPVLEQSQITSIVNAVLSQVDALIAEAERAIDLLQERRTALISAAVTGKIDVRGLVETEAA
jgi:type I restriction enzyme S subunit